MKPVLDYLARHQPRFVSELIDYVSIPSVSAQPQHQPDVRACAEWLRGHCQRIGLETRLCPTPGNPVLLARTPRRSGRRPHFLVYGHYDVQPAEPFELWKSDPFKPVVKGRSLFGRGASDNKGQHFAHLKAVEAYLRTGTELPCDLTFLIEGEEEVGSGSMAGFLRRHRRELTCNQVVVSDTGVPSPRHPALTCALRGIAALEVRVRGPIRDLHSGIYGGSVDNPAMVLAQVLGSLRDRRGRITVPGFYVDVAPLSASDRRQLARFPMSEAAYRRLLGVPRLFGESGFTSQERRTSRPTLEINGLTSGYQGEGSKTIIPAWASAKLTMRLVPNQRPQKIVRLVMRQLRRLCPRTVHLELEPGHCGAPYHVSPTSPAARAALRALKAAFGCPPVVLREGGSIPVVNDFNRILGRDTLLLGLALPDDNAHSPNEKFDLGMFERGMRLSALLWPELSR
jgi:acetylornithine deacetylase/succinyl-diaminopimelate desuccinylase-like protein